MRQMELLETIFTGIGLSIAIWALVLQRREIIKNGRINSLIYASQMLQERIDYHDQIIDDAKAKKTIWKGHADKINKELRPLKKQINAEFINLASKYDGVLHEEQLRQTLSLDTESIKSQ
jgi:hypothetical protein